MQPEQPVHQEYEEIPTFSESETISSPVPEHEAPREQESAVPEHLPEKVAPEPVFFEDEEENKTTGIRIGIYGAEQRKTSLMKHTVYLIRGRDKDGDFEVFRRFNEFFKCRKVITAAWPGCYVPSLPDKDPIKKNDEEVIKKRQRLLGEFLRKLASLPHIYYSQEVQCLFRSKENDLTAILDKWAKPTLEDIIKKYHDCFRELSGKQINTETATKIANFMAGLKRSASLIKNYKDMARRVAESRTKLNSLYPLLFASGLPVYEKSCIRDLIEGSGQRLLYEQVPNPTLTQNQLALEGCKNNPYWLIYDVMKLEERDGQAMMEAIRQKDGLDDLGKQLQFKIRENEAEIATIEGGGKSLKSMMAKGGKEEYISRLRTENQSLAQERQNAAILSDIISALLAYITIDQYTASKRALYYTRLRRLVRMEQDSINPMAQIWQQIGQHYKAVAV